MKTCSLLTSFSLGALLLTALIAGPAKAELSSAVAQGQPLTAELSESAPAFAAGDLGVFDPSWQDREQASGGSCTATTQCWGGATVTCSGSGPCISDCGSAYCGNGVQVECTCTVPAPSCPTGMDTAYCACRSCGGGHGHCYRLWCLNGGNSGY